MFSRRSRRMPQKICVVINHLASNHNSRFSNYNFQHLNYELRFTTVNSQFSKKYLRLSAVSVGEKMLLFIFPQRPLIFAEKFLLLLFINYQITSEETLRLSAVSAREKMLLFIFPQRPLIFAEKFALQLIVKRQITIHDCQFSILKKNSAHFSGFCGRKNAVV